MTTAPASLLERPVVLSPGGGGARSAVDFSASLQLCLSGFSLCPGPLDTLMSQTVKSEGKGAKRKAPEEEKNGSEELVEKKVCKGFQTV